MAKAATIKIKLVSSADTGFFYVTKKNSRTKTDKLVHEEVRPGRAQARRVPRSQDQVDLRRPRRQRKKHRLGGAFSICGLGGQN